MPFADILKNMGGGETGLREPIQKRSKESLEKLLAAAEQQIREGGLDSLTVQSVVTRSGLSVGAFYTRFDGKTAILRAVQERVHERLEPQIKERLAQAARESTCLEQAIERCFDVLIEAVLREQELSRAFMMVSVFDEVMRHKGEEVNRARRQALREALLSFRDEIGHENPELAIDMAYAMYAAVLRGRLVFGAAHELQLGISHETVFAELKRALVKYLKNV